MTKQLISPNLVESLVEQISHEKYNANLYLEVASFLNSKGLSNIAKHFEEQHEEEQGHSKIIYQLLVDLGIHFPMPAIEGISIPIESSIMDIATMYLERETLTTESLGDIKLQASDDKNHVVEERIREMITFQQAEYAEATDFVDKATNMKEWWQVALWDVALDVD